MMKCWNAESQIRLARVYVNIRAKLFLTVLFLVELRLLCGVLADGIIVDICPTIPHTLHGLWHSTDELTRTVEIKNNSILARGNPANDVFGSKLNVEIKADIVECYGKTQAMVKAVLDPGPEKSRVLCLWLQEGTNDLLEAKVIFAYAATQELINSKKHEIGCTYERKIEGRKFFKFVLIPKREINVQYLTCLKITHYHYYLDDAVAKFENLTIELCATFCIAKLAIPYFGVEVSGGCRCRLEPGSAKLTYSHRPLCAKKCPGNHTQLCARRGFWSMYRVNPSALGDGQYKGCFRGNRHDLPLYIFKSSIVNSVTCRFGCHYRGYQYAGINNQTCRCGQKPPSLHVGDEHCSIKCRPDLPDTVLNEKCGGLEKSKSDSGREIKTSYNSVYATKFKPRMRSIPSTVSSCQAVGNQTECRFARRGAMQCPEGCCYSIQRLIQRCYQPKLQKKLGIECNITEECLHPRAYCADEDGKHEKFSSCRCRPEDSYQHKHICRIKKKLGETCELNEDCHYKGGKCQAGVCVCGSDFYQIKEECFKKKALGLSCSSNVECIANHSLCDKTCVCEPEGYYAAAGQCVPKKALYLPCSSTSECLVKHAVCNNTCNCESGGFYAAQGQCVEKKALGLACSSTSECKVKHAVCDKTCICDHGSYYAAQGQCFPKKKLGESCDMEISCLLPEAKCKSGQCVCGEKYFKKNGRCFKKKGLHSSCSSTNECSVNHSVCDKTCICEPPGFYAAEGQCVPKRKLGERCGTQRDCWTEGSECERGTCKCGQGYYDSLTGQCFKKKALGLSCASPTECITKNSVCDKTCVCEPVGYYAAQGQCVPKKGLHSSCSSTNECSVNHSVCDKTCICEPPGFYAAEGQCVPKRKLGETCRTQRDCGTEGSECERGTCKCGQGYYDSLTGQCFKKKALGLLCTSTSECVTKHSVCDRTCICEPEGYYAAQGQCVPKTKFKQTCNSDVNCSGEGMRCWSRSCVCGEDYFTKNGTCFRKRALGHPCFSKNECRANHSVCDETCICEPEGFFAWEGNCLPKRRLGESCREHTHCWVRGAECLHGRCVCRYDSYYDHTYRGCVRKKPLGFPCSSNNECREVHSICYKTCVCDPRGYYAAVGQCIPKKRLGEACVVDTDCWVGGAYCLAGLCTCRDVYYQRMGACLRKKLLGMPCLSSRECKVMHSMCHGRCYCDPRGYYATEGQCFPKKLLGMPCLSSRECKVMHSVCHGRCYCDPRGYYAAKGQCFPRHDHRYNEPEHIPMIKEVTNSPTAAVLTTRKINLVHGNPIGVYKGNVLALEGLPVQITCHIPGQPVFLNHTFEWFYGDKRLHPNDRIQIRRSGELIILKAETNDTGTYLCRVRGVATSQGVHHQLTVYTLPEYTYELEVTYRVADCNRKNSTADFDDFRESLCPVTPCTIHQFSANCVSDQSMRLLQSGKNILKLSFTLGVEGRYKNPVCSPNCVQRITLAHMKNNLEVLKQKIKEKMSSRGLQIQRVENLRIVCAAGFTHVNTHCAPCPPGTYSERGHNSKCLPCAQGFYSSQHGSPGCAACPQHSTDITGASSVAYCVSKTAAKGQSFGLSDGIWIGVGPLFVLFLFLISCFIYRKYWRKMKNEGVRNCNCEQNVERPLLTEDGDAE